MTSLSIAWIYEPHDSPRFHLGRDDRFVQEVSRHAGVAIPYLEGRLQDIAPMDGFILLNSFGPSHSLSGCDPERRDELASRLVAMDVSNSRIFERVLEPLSLAAAVDVFSHLAWQKPESVPGGTQFLYGLREISSDLQVDLEGDSSPRYCRMLSEPPGGLPHLLVRYLLSLLEHRARKSEKVSRPSRT